MVISRKCGLSAQPDLLPVSLEETSDLEHFPRWHGQILVPRAVYELHVDLLYCHVWYGSKQDGVSRTGDRLASLSIYHGAGCDGLGVSNWGVEGNYGPASTYSNSGAWGVGSGDVYPRCGQQALVHYPFRFPELDWTQPRSF